IRDTKWLLYELRLLDPEMPNVAVRHFTNMNLFTQVSNGDDFADIDELTYYIPLLVSTKKLAMRVRDVITPICTTGELDPLGWKKMDLKCFRQEFYHRKTDFWDHFPDMIITYDN